MRRHPYLRRRCILAACLIVPLAAHSRDGVDPAVQDTVGPAELAPIVVTATRAPADPLLVPAAVDSIDAREIERAQPRIDLSETLHRIPGVVARDRQNQAQDLQVSIRGFGARSTFGVRGVRLFTDGIPATMPDGQGQVSHFSLQSAERIEVLRGPFSALYGNASGGVIELFTGHAPAIATLEGGLVGGADGLLRSSLSWRAPWGEAGEGDALLDLVDLRSDGYRRHSEAHRRNGQALLRGAFGANGRFTLLANLLDLEADDPQGLTAQQMREDPRAASAGALLFDTRKTVRQDQVGARLEQDVASRQQVVVTVHGGRRATTQMLSVPVAVQRNVPLHNGGAIDLDRDYGGVDARWRWDGDLAARPLSLTAGVQYEVADERRLGFENFIGERAGVVGALRRDEANRVSGRDLYLQAEWAPVERWRMHLGARRSTVRFDSRDRFITDINPDDSGTLEYSRTSPVAGVLLRVTPETSVYANAGGGFETPTFAELAYRSDGLGGLNNALRPARSRNLEMGVRARHPSFSYSAAVFQSRTRDELVVVSNQDGRSIYDNASLSRRRGLELAVSGGLAPRWHYSTALTWLDARYLKDFAVCAAPPCDAGDTVIEAGRHIPGLARRVAWGELRFAADANTDVILDGRYVDRVFVDDANSESASPYARFDLAAEHRFDFAGLRWRGFARIENLLDRAHAGSVIVNDGNGRYYEPAPGRTWVLGISVARRFR